MSRSNEPVIASCHPVSTRAQLPPGSDVQGHRPKPYTHLPQPSSQLSQGLGGGVLLEFLPWLPMRSLNFTDYKPRFDSVVPLSQLGFRALSTGQHLGQNGRQCCENKAGGWLPASSWLLHSGLLVQTWEQISKGITRAITVAKSTAVT